MYMIALHIYHAAYFYARVSVQAEPIPAAQLNRSRSHLEHRLPLTCHAPAFLPAQVKVLRIKPCWNCADTMNPTI